ncbi:sensor histidine kinase [Vibrio fortis]|uniref:Sensor histidine kinase n=1 Tax=Vibrio fortis TaxID=212667 RepID=A0A5N3QXT8_9VIBR|nr:ATP-binding protein [Vibrio fortis]KAB0286943.1 sensor histidine kinase [Vibrio fortis]
MAKNQHNELVLESMHELRYFNQQLKNFAEQLSIDLHASKVGENRKLDMKPQQADKVRTLAENIANLSQLFTTRIDFIDVELNPCAIEHLPIQQVSIYGKFDKAKKMLNSMSRKKKVKLNFHCDVHDLRVIEAYSIIDILPYLLLDNAIKYAPERTAVDVKFEYYDDCVKIEISSEGPFVGSDELKKLSDKHYRGRNVVKLDSCVGRGLGLYYVGYIAELHDIEVSYQSDKYSYSVDGVPHSNFTVFLSVPFE